MVQNTYKFTKTFIANLPIPKKRTFYYDSVENGLILQVTPSGKKSYYLYKRVNGQPMRIFLGGLEKLLTPEMAREAAVRLKMNINEGEQPYSRKNENKLTLKQLYDDFMSEKEGILRPQTLYNYKSIWNNKLQKIGQKAVKNITSDELKVLHKHITAEHGSYIANQAVVLVRTLINYAIKEGKYKNFNPAIAVKLNKKEARARYLTHEEIKRFLSILYQYDNFVTRDAILMLLYTGARKSNVLSMAWCDIDIDAKIWKIPQTKTDENVTIALVEPALEILRERKEYSDSVWVFPSPTSHTGHLVEIKTAWNALIKKANITNFRVHDLRHTLATYLIANGADAFMVKRALTHKSLQSTQVYVNLGVEHLRDKLNDTVEKMIKISKE